MIPIHKDLKAIPESLKVDEEAIAHNPAKTTHERRNELIARGDYTPTGQQSAPYDNRYKYKDIKNALMTLYHGKCAYCEMYDPSPHVEHYRPKRGGYYWMAYSWDNLILSCSQCNIRKGNQFPIVGQKVSFHNTSTEFAQINTLSEDYDKIEQPLLLMPERMSSDIENLWAFDQNGSIVLNNDRIRISRDVYELDREELCRRRKKIWDELVNCITECVAMAKGDSSKLTELLQTHLNSFKRGAEDETNEYLAFRRYVLKSGWIGKKIIELTINDTNK